MRVLYLLGQFPAVSETFIAREILALRKLGAHVRIAALEKCRDPLVHDFVRPLAAEALYPTVQTRRLGRMLGRAFCAGTAPRRLLKCRRLSKDAEGRQLLAQAGALAPLVRRLGVDHIHTHFASSNCEMLIYLSGLTDVPFSFTAHAHDIFRRPRLLAEKIAAAKFVATISEYNRRYLAAIVGPDHAGKIHVVRCGLEPDEFPERPEAPPDRRLEIVSVGRLVPKKGHDVLIEALGAMRDVEFRCRIVGDGPLGADLAQLAERQGISERVEFAGLLPNEQVRQTLMQADLFVLACRQARDGNVDGIPVALMEAMALGVPVVSTQVTGIPELVRPGAGFLVSPQSPLELARCIRDFKALPAAARRRIGANARRQIARCFNARTEARKLWQLITDAEAVDAAGRHAGSLTSPEVWQ